MPSKPAMAAAKEQLQWIKRGESSLDPIASIAAIIDAHFAPYLAAVEALRLSQAWLSGSLSHDKARHVMVKIDDALSLIDSPHNAATLAPGDQG